MYLAYVDESGDPAPGGSRHLILGAAVVFEGRWSYLRLDIDRLLSKYFPTPPRPAEIHCTEVRQRRGMFRRLTTEQSDALLREFCSNLAAMLEIDLRMFAVVYDKALWFRIHPGRSGYDLYVEAFENLIGRIDLFLRRRHAEGHPSKALMVVDPHSTNLSTALKLALQAFQTRGTRWGSLYNVIETVMFAGSHESPGLQVADLCTFAIHRLVNQQDSSLVRGIAKVFDSEPVTSAVDPGKLHGVRYYGPENAIHTQIRDVWPNYVRP